MGAMKTTLEIPDPLFRRAKARAAERGQSLKAFVTEALEERLATGPAAGAAQDPKWMSGFGKLRQLHDETARVQRVIDDAFEAIEDEDRR
jgi:hypothetical protein